MCRGQRATPDLSSHHRGHRDQAESWETKRMVKGRDESLERSSLQSVRVDLSRDVLELMKRGKLTFLESYSKGVSVRLCQLSPWHFLLGSLLLSFFCYFNYSLISEELFWIYGTFLTRLFWHFKVTQIQGLHNMASIFSPPSPLYTQNSKQRNHLFPLKTSALVFVFPLIIVPPTYIISLSNLLIKAFCRHCLIHLHHYILQMGGRGNVCQFSVW